ncbi:MAG: helix-turn-helix transcriptional regulator [Bacteroidales bacterium]|nr:helix-turn-helix transcriptional regulator [Bacteroidales bacterium]
MAIEDLIIVGQNIAKIRKEKGLTQAELAEKIGIKRTLMTDYEIGRVRIPADIVIEIAKTLKVSADLILGLINDKADAKKPSLRLMKRLYEIENLSEVDQKTLLRTIDKFLKD